MTKKLLTLSLLTSSALMAVTPTTGDILRQVEQPKLPVAPKALPSVGAGEYKAPLSAKDDVVTFVKSFKFSGNTAFSSEILSSLVKPYEGKDLGINGLKEVASIITKYYRDNGYFVARAYIPAQSMEEGIIEIAIIEGQYGSFELKNSSLVDTSEVQGFMDHLKGGELVSTMSLERQMLLVNDLSGAQVTNAEVYPGQAVGTSDFRITVSPTPKYNGYAIADNYGSRYTGENRLSAGLNINSLSGIGDTLSLSTLISNTADLKNIRVGYDRPLGYAGLKGGVSVSMTDYTLDEINNFEGYGRTNSYNAYISYPTLKTRAHTQTVEASYDHKEMRDTSGIPDLTQESKKQLDALTLKATDKRNTSIANLPGSLFTSVGYTIGHLGLKNDTARDNDAGLNSAGNYTKLTLNAIHSQYLIENTTLQTTFKAQKSFGNNLDSAEDLSVGGSNGVRAYEDSELSGDQGYSLSLDLIYSLPKVAQITHNTSLFFDHAKVWRNDTTFNADENIRTLNAIGIGYSLSYQNFDLKATLAHGFGDERSPQTEQQFHTHSNKFLVQGMMRF
jgi:hemolysin activation/secretion protein